MQYPREGQVYSFQKMDHRPAMEFEINRATYAAASISISASRSAMTSSKAEIACWTAAICINSQPLTGPLRFCSDDQIPPLLLELNKRQTVVRQMSHHGSSSPEIEP